MKPRLRRKLLLRLVLPVEAGASANSNVAININSMAWEDLDRYAADGYDNVVNGFANKFDEKKKNFDGIVVVIA